MNRSAYTPSTRSRIVAFLFTDRVGQTLAATLGLASVARWWAGKKLRRR